MSMSQEEIEALMNGLDISDEETEEVEAENNVNTDEIEQLLSQSEGIKDDIESNEEDKSSTVDNNSVDDLIDEFTSESSESLVNNDEINDLLKDIELDSEDNEDKSDESNISLSDNELDNILNDNDSSQSESLEKNENKSINEDEIVRNWASGKIDEGVIPWPAEKDTKVVNQLSQVANDSEEKVGQIFDVLSLSLDNNNNLRNEIKNLNIFLEKEKKLLESLNQKFPNISHFSSHLSEISKINDSINLINTNSFEEDSKIFEAMELMQFNDINRQKIERVMSVIRKLSNYLNNLFEDEGNSSEIAVAKHIHGDDSNDLIGDDLDKLIEDFANKK
ncbi:hypothetical protein GCM10012288_08050 [Malaciobacter pacificus]|uniref:Uncharacterized protein n=2 Tax=Malaciobacter pacificus TaxID=1080223 RepID=A0A5C2HEB7_9BACT|nr:hypothetical protein [Malaciobacter pacificus]QEP35144.1 hypothetical protein APAC_2072 [Malaciobacter pacificus]GGD36426.1 hypothetical protein GCM10012288_08050 [Malaciobacter pacificus]